MFSRQVQISSHSNPSLISSYQPNYRVRTFFSKFSMTLGLAVTLEIFQNRLRVFKVNSTDTNSGVDEDVIFGLFNYSPPSCIFLALTSAVIYQTQPLFSMTFQDQKLKSMTFWV